MKADSAPINILFDFITASPLNDLISGVVYKDGQRPNDSPDEDIVINSLGLTGDWMQRGVCNVNIHVADLLITKGGKKQYVKNVNRLDTLATLAVTTLKEFYSQEYFFRLANQSVIPQPDIHQHYINIRIDFRFLPS